MECIVPVCLTTFAFSSTKNSRYTSHKSPLPSMISCIMAFTNSLTVLLLHLQCMLVNANDIYFKGKSFICKFVKNTLYVYETVDHFLTKYTQYNNKFLSVF